MRGARIGAPSEAMANNLLEEKGERGVVRIGPITNTFDGQIFCDAYLSLGEWGTIRVTVPLRGDRWHLLAYRLVLEPR